MNFGEIHSLMQQIVIDWEKPSWIIRAASIYLLLGEKSMALNFYNRAIQAAEQKKDEWNLYIAYWAKWIIMNDFFERESYQEKEREEVRQAVRRLSQKLKETKNQSFQRWQEYDELKAKWWSDYKEWKHQLGPNQKGFHSFKSEAIYQVYEMIYFYEMNGLPYVSMTGKKFDVILDIFIENNHKVKGTLLAILLGQEKQLKNAFRFEALSDVTENERNILYQQSTTFADNLIWYIRTLRKNSYTSLVERCVPALIQFWNQLVPILGDEEIDTVADYCYKLFSEIQRVPFVDPFASAMEKLISVIDLCIFFRQRLIDQERLFEILHAMRQNARLIRAFSVINWKLFEKQRKNISNELMESVIGHIDYSETNLLYEWLDADLLSDEQKEKIMWETYIKSKECMNDRELQRRRFLLLNFFKENVEGHLKKEIIMNAIEIFRESLSSSNIYELYLLGNHVEEMSEDQIKLLMDESENKISQLSNRNVSVFSQQEIASSYLYFLNKLRIAGRIANDVFLEKFHQFYQLEINTNEILADLAQNEEYFEVVSEKLLNGSYSIHVNVRKNCCFLIGYWLKERPELTERDQELLERILISLNDTNVKVSSEAVRGFALILKDNHKLLPAEIIENVIKVTERSIQRNEISYLTNLAFLYKELSKLETLSDATQRKITQVLERLSHSSYSNVRRECRI